MVMAASSGPFACSSPAVSWPSGRTRSARYQRQNSGSRAQTSARLVAGGGRRTEQAPVPAAEHDVAVDRPAEVAEARVAGVGGDPAVDEESERAERHTGERDRERDAVTGGAGAHRARRASLTGRSPPFNRDV